MHFAFDENEHILWGMRKPTIVMTDKKPSKGSSSPKGDRKTCGITATRLSNSTSSWLTFLVSKTQNPITCPMASPTRKTGSTSKSKTRYLCSESKSTQLRKHTNEMTKKNTSNVNQMQQMLLQQQTPWCRLS